MKPKQFFSAVTVGWLAVALCLPLAARASPVAAHERNELRTLQLSAGADATRVVIGLAHAPQWKLFTLDRPDRAVLDLQRTRLPGSFRPPAAAGLVSAVRSGPQANGTLRLVIDLADRARVKAALLPAAGGQGPRLVITVAGRASGAAAERASNAAAREPVAEVPAAAASTLPVRAAHAPGDTGRPIIIAVDAGHGGPDPGATGRGGTREKDVVLGIARALAERINREPGMRAVLTRDGDYFLTLRQRIAKARAVKADMFVSVHADSVRNPEVSGASVYVLSEKGATNEQARWLAERENAADLKGGVSLDDKDATLATVLLDLSQTASLSASLQAADRVLSSLVGVGQVRKPQVQQAGFVVLKSPDIPSMLVETAYISNPQDERRLREPGHQELLAHAIFSGVHGYFRQNPPDGTRYARGSGGGAKQTLALSAP